MDNFNNKIGTDFMRQEEINILRYLPDFLQSSDTFKEVADAHSREHQLQRDKLEDLFRQCFVSTATWGLVLWESELDLDTNESESYETRRKRIWNKLQSKQTSTLQFMTDLLNKYTDTGDGSINEIYDQYKLEYYIQDGSITSWKDLLEAIQQWKPAHLGFYFITHTDLGEEVYFGGVVSEVEEIYIPCDSNYQIETGATAGNKPELDYVQYLQPRKDV